MNISTLNKKLTLALLALVITGSTYAASYTAIASGNFSSTTTWLGGTAPSATDLTDQIVIPNGINVNLDNNLSINGAAASLTVAGALTSTTSTLTVTLGSVAGTGTIAVNTLDVNTSTGFSFTGSLAANTLNSTTGFQSAATIMVGQTLNLTAGTLSLATGGSLGLSNNGTIAVSGGLLSIGTGTVGLSSNYSVVYSGVSSIAGVELSGSGLQNITVNVTGPNSVTLISNLTVAGTLSLTSGSLMLAGHDLTLNGSVAATGTGTITPTLASNININSVGGTTGTLTFGGATPTVNNLTINVGASNQAHIGGTLAVGGTLQLNSGTLNFNSTDLTLNGSISGSGTLSANSASNLAITNTLANTTALNFVAGGQSVNNLSVAIGATSTASLLSNLTVNGALALTGVSNLSLNGNTLTLGATSSVTGLGALTATSTSGLVVNSTGGVPSLNITGTIGNVTITTGGTSSVTLANSLTTAGMLTLQSGMLVLNGHNLNILGNVAATGTGTISSTATSNITVATATATGALNFTSTANTVGNFVVNVTSGAAHVGSDLNIADSLKFTSGMLNIGGNALVIATLGGISGASSTSYVVTTAGGYLEQHLTALGSVATNFPVGTATSYAPANVLLNTGSASGQIQVGIVSGVLAQGTTGVDLSLVQPLVAATWNVHSDITSNLNLNLQLEWMAAMQVNGFNANAAYVSHYTNGAWDVSAATAVTDEAGGLFSMTKTALTSLSPFSVFEQRTATAVNEISNNVKFDVFPNPTHDNITIQTATLSAEAVNMEIYNALGQMVSSTKLTAETSTIPVGNLVNGSYFIKLYNHDMNSTKQFIKM